MFKIMETPISKDRLISLNQKCTMTAVIIAKMIPFKTPIINSFPTIRLKLLVEISCFAIALIVTASVCIPAFPPIDATIGIKKASATICSIDAPKKLITHVANKAVNKLSNSQLNLSLLIGVSMILNMIVAGLFGILVPVSLKKLNIDPALASSVFVTTITDVIGFLSFLGLGSYYFLN